MFREASFYQEILVKSVGKRVEAFRQRWARKDSEVKEVTELAKKLASLKNKNLAKNRLTHRYNKLKVENGELKKKLLITKAENREMRKLQRQSIEKIIKLEDELETRKETMLKVEEYACRREDHFLRYCEELFVKNEQLEARLKNLEQGLRVEELKDDNNRGEVGMSKIEDEQMLKMKNERLEARVEKLKRKELEQGLENEQLKIQLSTMRMKEAERKKKIIEMEKKKREEALKLNSPVSKKNEKMERLTMEWKKRAAECTKDKELEEMFGGMSIIMEESELGEACELEAVVTIVDNNVS